MKAVNVRYDGRARYHATILPLLYLALLATVLVSVYRPAWDIPPYADDFHVMIAAEAGIRGGAYEGEFMFRPLELFVVQASLFLQDGLALPRTVSFAGLLASIGLVFWLAQRIAPAEAALPFVAAALFGAHSLNVIAVSQIDTVSQQLATVMTLAMFGWYVFGPHERLRLYHGIGATLVLLALLSKEAAVGVVFALPFVLTLVEVGAKGLPLRAAVRRNAPVLAYVAVLFGLYMLLRHWAGAIVLVDEGIERYTFEPTPVNVIKNMVLLLGGPAYLGSTLEIFLLDAPLRIATSAFLTIAFNGLALFGLVRALPDLRRDGPERRSLALVGALGLMLGASLFPISITGWPSELHAYLVTPFYVLIASFFALRGWKELVSRLPLQRRLLHAGGVAALAASCLWLLFGVSEKLAHSANVGARSDAFLAQVSAWYAEMRPTGDPVLTCVADEAQAQALYSVFAPPTYSLLQPMIDWLNYRHGARLQVPLFPETAACEALIEARGDALALRPLDT